MPKFLAPFSLFGLPSSVSMIESFDLDISNAPAPLLADAVKTYSPSLHIAGLSSDVPVPIPIVGPPT